MIKIIGWKKYKASRIKKKKIPNFYLNKNLWLLFITVSLAKYLNRFAIKKLTVFSYISCNLFPCDAARLWYCYFLLMGLLTSLGWSFSHSFADFSLHSFHIGICQTSTQDFYCWSHLLQWLQLLGMHGWYQYYWGRFCSSVFY